MQLALKKKKKDFESHALRKMVPLSLRVCARIRA